MATSADGRPDSEEHPSASVDVQEHSRAEALAVVEALIDFSPEAGTLESAAWKERIVTLLRMSRQEERAHPHARRQGAPPALMSQRWRWRPRSQRPQRGSCATHPTIRPMGPMSKSGNGRLEDGQGEEEGGEDRKAGLQPGLGRPPGRAPSRRCRPPGRPRPAPRPDPLQAPPASRPAQAGP